MQRQRVKQINYKKIAIELLIIATVILGISVPVFLSKSNPRSNDANDRQSPQVQNLSKLVEEYDFSKGRSQELENKIDDMLLINRSVEQKQFLLIIKARYYYGLSYYNTALANLEKALSIAQDDEQYRSALEELVKVSHAAKDIERESQYQFLLDRIL